MYKTLLLSGNDFYVTNLKEYVTFFFLIFFYKIVNLYRKIACIGD